MAFCNFNRPDRGTRLKAGDEIWIIYYKYQFEVAFMTAAGLRIALESENDSHQKLMFAIKSYPSSVCHIISLCTGLSVHHLHGGDRKEDGDIEVYQLRKL